MQRCRTTQPALRAALCCLNAALVFGLVIRSISAQETESEAGLQAYATSVPFHLHPKVERASFSLRRPTLEAVYRAIGSAYGIKLIFDPDFPSANLVTDFNLQDVTLEQALDAAEEVTKAFLAPLDEHTGIVSADTGEKREHYERQVLGSFRMDDETTPQQLTDISTALRTILDLRRISVDTRDNWITMRGRMHQVELAQEFLRGLRKAPGEVMLDVEFLEVDSTRARSLGIVPPQPVVLSFLGSLGSGSTTLTALRLGAGLYGIVLPGASASLTYNSSVVRSHQTLHLRASQGKEASLLAGEKYPVALATQSAGSTPSTASSSFSGYYPALQYENIGFVVKATPFIHEGREVTLQLKITDESLGPLQANGLPSFSNREISQEIRLSDGEAFLIGGILTRSEQKSTMGYPLLSRLPLIRYLFTSFQKETDETELMILIRPLIVRANDAVESESTSLYFGRELLGIPAPAQQGLPPLAPGAAVPLPPGAAPPPASTVPGVSPTGAPIPTGSYAPQVPSPQPGTVPAPAGVQPNLPMPQMPPGMPPGTQPGIPLQVPGAPQSGTPQ